MQFILTYTHSPESEVNLIIMFYKIQAMHNTLLVFILQLL